MRYTIILLSAILFFSAEGLSQTTWYVDADNVAGPWNGSQQHPFLHIQDGVIAASASDTVLVMPGTYMESVEFLGKAITVRSQLGPELTVIDANGVDTAVIFHAGEDEDSVLEGFTVTNGNDSNGAGIHCQFNSSPTIKGNIITGNNGTKGCAGIWCNASSPIIIHNVITGNVGSTGTAIYFANSSPTIVGNIISGNTASSKAGGIGCNNSTPIIANNIIFENTAANAGGGIYLYLSSPVIINNTIFGNSAVNAGGGIYCDQSSPRIMNSILWNNDAPAGPEIFGSPAVSYCDVEGGWPGPGNIDQNPLFVDSGNGDFHLTWPSPCRESGDNSSPGLSDIDFEGDFRIAGGTVDMGADEFYTHLYYMGNAIPGGTVNLKFVDNPGATPVGFWIALNALDNPLPGAYGDWYLLPPMMGPIPLGTIPSNGVLVLTGNLPVSPPAPYTLFLQAIIGTPLKLTNLLCLQVK